MNDFFYPVGKCIPKKVLDTAIPILYNKTMICKVCNNPKTKNDFYPGNLSRCKKCKVQYSIEWQKNNPKKTRIIQKRTRDKKEHKDKQRGYYRKWYAQNGRNRADNYQENIDTWCKEHKKEQHVHWKTIYAIRTGRLVRPETCEQCGETHRVVAHHPDYQEPYLVEWLCYSCHKLGHNHV